MSRVLVRFVVDTGILVSYAALFGFYVFYLSDYVHEYLDIFIRVAALVFSFFLFDRACKSQSKWLSSRRSD